MIANRAVTIAKRGDDCKRRVDARTRTVRSGTRLDNPGYLVSFPDYRPQLVRESGHGNETGIKQLMMESEDFEAVLAMEQAIVRLGARFPISVGEQNEVLRRSADVVQTALAIEPYLLDGQSLVSQCIQVRYAVSVLYETQQEQVVCRGRPQISITEEQLRYFVELPLRCVTLLICLVAQSEQLSVDCRSMVLFVSVDTAIFQMITCQC